MKIVQFVGLWSRLEACHWKIMTSSFLPTKNSVKKHSIFSIKFRYSWGNQKRGINLENLIFKMFSYQRKNIASIFSSLIIICLVTSCRSEMKVKVRTGAKKPVVATPSKIEPKEIIDGLNIDRTHLQSRTPISIVISADTVTSANYFSLINESSNQTLISQQALSLTDDPASSFQITNPDPALELSGYELTIKIYPLDPSFQGKFTAGQNILKVVTESDTEPKQAKTTLTRKDYYLLAAGGGSFSSLEQRANGLELYPGMELGQSAVTNGTRVLITNPVSLMSR